MKKYLKTAVTIVAALIIILVSAWRLWPHTLSNVISMDENAAASIACIVNISGLDNDGTSLIDNYRLQSLTNDDEEFSAILDILKSSEYRQDFQNLLPWAVTSIGSDSGRTAQVFLTWGNNESDTCYLIFYEKGKVAVGFGKNNGYKVYHAIDDSILDKLADYVKKCGVKN